LGTIILEKGILGLKQTRSAKIRIIGYVKKGNTASVNAFLNLGFEQTVAERYPDAFCFILD
jgi:hypothetical protein